MTNISQFPAYNLKAVLNETGLTADVLRAWERRYGLPKPHRTPGGHRLYSEYDILTIKWLQARQAEGLSISRAVKLWEEARESGQDPLVDFALAGGPAAPEHLPAGESNLKVLRGHWLEAGLSFDEKKAEEVLNQAFAMYPVEMVCAEIIQQGMNAVGNDWYHNKVTVQQEHFLSALALRRLQTLLAATPRPTRKQTVLVGCAPGEWHTIPVLVLCLLLRRNGLDVIYLGSDIPIDQLEETIAVVHPSLVVLAAQRLVTAAALRSVMVGLRSKRILLAYGGYIFNHIPALRERVPAHFLGESLEGAAQQVERLLLAPAAAPGILPTGESYEDLARLFREKRPILDASLYEIMQGSGLNPEYVEGASAFFSSALSAALELGDPAFMEPDLEWVEHLLAGRQISADHLKAFLAVYSRVIEKELGEAARPITRWIADYINLQKVGTGDSANR